MVRRVCWTSDSNVGGRSWTRGRFRAPDVDEATGTRSHRCALSRIGEYTGSDHVFFFFFQAEDGIRDRNVTGVQTCALPIYQDSIFTNSVNQKPFYLSQQPTSQSIPVEQRQSLDCY